VNISIEDHRVVEIGKAPEYKSQITYRRGEYLAHEKWINPNCDRVQTCIQSLDCKLRNGRVIFFKFKNDIKEVL
jgi:hypothetical protein